jgi:hypothetical protein
MSLVVINAVWFGYIAGPSQGNVGSFSLLKLFLPAFAAATEEEGGRQHHVIGTQALRHNAHRQA